MEKMNLPIYNALITDGDEGILKISLVDLPAVESDFVAFDQEKRPLMFAVENEEERMILGCIMRADFPIYRCDDFRGEYYIKYSKETCKIMAEKLMADDNHNNINLMHLEGTDVNGVHLVQIFIKDTEKGIDPVGFESIENGSIFAQYKVENDAVWREVKDGTFKGFSLEGLFTVEIENNTDKKKDYMSKLKQLLAKILVAFGNVGDLFFEGDEIAVGTEVTDKEGNPIEDGEYTVEGKIYVIKDSKVEEIKDAEEPAEEPAEDEVPVEEKKCVKGEDEEPAEEPAPAENTEIDSLRGQIEELRGLIEALTNRVADLEGKPAVEPIVEEFKRVTVTDTKDKNVNLAVAKFKQFK